MNSWYIFASMTAGSLLLIYLTARYSLYQSRKYFDKCIDDLAKEANLTLYKASALADSMGKETNGLHESIQNLSGAIDSIKGSRRELTDLFKKL